MSTERQTTEVALPDGKLTPVEVLLDTGVLALYRHDGVLYLHHRVEHDRSADGLITFVGGEAEKLGAALLALREPSDELVDQIGAAVFDGGRRPANRAAVRATLALFAEAVTPDA